MSRSIASSIVATVVSVCTVTACSSKATPSAAPPTQTNVAAPVTPDAYVPGITTIGTVDPSGVHIDDDSSTPAPTVRNPPRVARHLEVLLRSTPPGALASVDGVAIGATPTLWEGEFTGREREFTFALAGHRVARYRFVPLNNGVVHGRLEENELVPGMLGGPPFVQLNTPPPARAPVPAKPPAVAPVSPPVAPPVTPPFVATPDASAPVGSGSAIAPDATNAPAAPM
jgi:hypothetical protein